MNEELDSQLSAMFDNELPAAECELLARRLSRDEELKARWSRYAAIGATIRAEGGRAPEFQPRRAGQQCHLRRTCRGGHQGGRARVRERAAQGNAPLADAAGRSRSGCQCCCRARSCS